MFEQLHPSLRAPAPPADTSTDSEKRLSISDMVRNAEIGTSAMNPDAAMPSVLPGRSMGTKNNSYFQKAKGIVKGRGEWRGRKGGREGRDKREASTQERGWLCSHPMSAPL